MISRGERGLREFHLDGCNGRSWEQDKICQKGVERRYIWYKKSKKWFVSEFLKLIKQDSEKRGEMQLCKLLLFYDP